MSDASEGRFWSGTAVVTGGGSGLGAAIADRFVSVGMSVALLDIDGARAEDHAAAIRSRGGVARAWKVDVSDREALGGVAAEVRSAFGGCTVLGANVGVQQFGAIDRLEPNDWRWVLDVNVLGMINTVDAFLPLLRSASGNRRIVVTSSSSVLVPGVRLGAYVASKYAVTGYAETLRLELAPEGIGVSILFPAGMSSRHLASSVEARPPELGPSVMLPDDIDAMLASRKMDAVAHTKTPEYATRNLLAELERDERFIVTHGQYRDELQQRNDDLLAAFDRAQE